MLVGYVCVCRVVYCTACHQDSAFYSCPHCRTPPEWRSLKTLQAQIDPTGERCRDEEQPQ